MELDSSLKKKGKTYTPSYLSIRLSFTLTKNNNKFLHLSYKMDLDFQNCLTRETHLIPTVFIQGFPLSRMTTNT